MLELPSCILTITHARKNLKDLSYVKNSADSHTINGRGTTNRIRGQNITNFLSTDYKIATASTIVNVDYGIAFANGNTDLIYVRNKDLTQDEFIAAMVNSDAYIVYPLATPIVIQLNPVTVTTLLGQNNIWADAGQVTITDGSVLSSIYTQLSAFSNYLSSLQS